MSWYKLARSFVKHGEWPLEEQRLVELEPYPIGFVGPAKFDWAKSMDAVRLPPELLEAKQGNRLTAEKWLNYYKEIAELKRQLANGKLPQGSFIPAANAIAEHTGTAVEDDVLHFFSLWIWGRIKKLLAINAPGLYEYMRATIRMLKQDDKLYAAFDKAVSTDEWMDVRQRALIRAEHDVSDKVEEKKGHDVMLSHLGPLLDENFEHFPHMKWWLSDAEKYDDALGHLGRGSPYVSPLVYYMKWLDHDRFDADGKKYAEACAKPYWK